MGTNVGFMGMGKLALPIAYAYSSKGHNVMGYDVMSKPYEYVKYKNYPLKEEGLDDLLDNEVKMAYRVSELVEHSDIIFVAVQTPHPDEYDGSQKVPSDHIDFDYSYLVDACDSLFQEVVRLGKVITISVVSTVLPGTMDKHVYPLFDKYPEAKDLVGFVYNPHYIAMGTVVPDILNPEFTLIGSDNETVLDYVESFYKTIHDKPKFRTDVKTAEGIKMLYNSMISVKIALGNTWGEMAAKTGMNADHIVEALSLSTDRLISSKYLNPGLGDGGQCHPRDIVALSHLSDKVGMSYNLFEALIEQKENHLDWILEDFRNRTGVRTKFLLGTAFKKNSYITTGSSSMYFAKEYPGFIQVSETETIEEAAKAYAIRRSYGDVVKPLDLSYSAFLIGVDHDMYKDLQFPKGSFVYDPWGIIDDQEGVEVYRVGRN